MSLSMPSPWALLRRAILVALVVAASPLGCSGGGGGDVGGGSVPPGPQSPPKAVYTMTNALAGNEVLVYLRAADGTLALNQAVATGGTGTADFLKSQGALFFQSDRNRFFAVNPGSDSVAMLVLGTSGALTLVDTVPSGGDMPTSVTAFGDLVYVMNAGNITAFTVQGNALVPLAGSTRPLSAPLPQPAQVDFSPSGGVLAVTEKASNVISTYVVNPDGTATGPTVHPSVGQTPFGFVFSHLGFLIVTEAFNDVAGLGATSSYSVSSAGAVVPITPSLATTETSTCWATLVPDSSVVYVTNTLSASVSGYAVSNTGALTLLDAGGVTGVTGGGPIDCDVTEDGQFLYTLNFLDDTISLFRVNAGGSLTKIPDLPGVPDGAAGLVAR